MAAQPARLSHGAARHHMAPHDVIRRRTRRRTAPHGGAHCAHGAARRHTAAHTAHCTGHKAIQADSVNTLDIVGDPPS
eukprot:gene1211-biopygen8258